MVIYDELRSMTWLPIAMTWSRIIVVLVLTLAMLAGSAWMAVRIVRRADPADLF